MTTNKQSLRFGKFFFFNKVVWFKLMNKMKGLWVIQRANGEHLFSTRLNVKVMLKKTMEWQKMQEVGYTMFMSNIIKMPVKENYLYLLFVRGMTKGYFKLLLPVLNYVVKRNKGD